MSKNGSVKLSEPLVFQLLRDRYAKPGNGGAGEYAVLGAVRDGAAFDANRTFDAVLVNLWPSRGLAIHVLEVKVSRSDWQRELRKPDKAESACRFGDYFSIVAPAGCVRDGELPPTWGLIEVHGDGDTKPFKLKEKAAAPRLHSERPQDRPVSRSQLVGLLRSCPGAIPGGKVPSPNQAELDAERQKGYEAGQRDTEYRLRQARTGNDALAEEARKLVDALVEAGVARYGVLSELSRRAADIAAMLNGTRALEQVAYARGALKAALDRLDQVLADR